MTSLASFHVLLQEQPGLFTQSHTAAIAHDPAAAQKARGEVRAIGDADRAGLPDSHEETHFVGLQDALKDFSDPLALVLRFGVVMVMVMERIGGRRGGSDFFRLRSATLRTILEVSTHQTCFLRPGLVASQPGLFSLWPPPRGLFAEAPARYALRIHCALCEPRAQRKIQPASCQSERLNKKLRVTQSIGMPASW